MDAYIRAVTFLSRVAGVFAALLIGLAVLVICDMVVERYFSTAPTIWQIDVVTYCIVAATFIGSAYVLMTRGHVNVDILPLHLGPRAPLLARAVHRSCWRWASARAVRSLHGSFGTRPGRKSGARIPCGARGCGFPIFRCRSVSAFWSCNISPTCSAC